jgi:hypothetical protein
MSVIVIARFPVSDLARAQAALAENSALLEEITEDTKKLGAIHHTFAAGENELIVVGEWDTAEILPSVLQRQPEGRDGHGRHRGPGPSDRRGVRAGGGGRHLLSPAKDDPALDTASGRQHPR